MNCASLRSSDARLYTNAWGSAADFDDRPQRPRASFDVQATCSEFGDEAAGHRAPGPGLPPARQVDAAPACSFSGLSDPAPDSPVWKGGDTL